MDDRRSSIDNRRSMTVGRRPPIVDRRSSVDDRWSTTFSRSGRSSVVVRHENSQLRLEETNDTSAIVTADEPQLQAENQAVNEPSATAV